MPREIAFLSPTPHYPGDVGDGLGRIGSWPTFRFLAVALLEWYLAQAMLMSLALAAVTRVMSIRMLFVATLLRGECVAESYGTKGGLVLFDFPNH